MTDRKKHGMAFWATVAAAVVLVAYPLSFGPACWWFSTAVMPGEFKYATHGTLTSLKYKYAPRFYWPIGWLAVNGPNSVGRVIRRYARIGSEYIFLPVDSRGREWSGD